MPYCKCSSFGRAIASKNRPVIQSRYCLSGSSGGPSSHRTQTIFASAVQYIGSARYSRLSCCVGLPLVLPPSPRRKPALDVGPLADAVGQDAIETDGPCPCGTDRCSASGT